MNRDKIKHWGKEGRSLIIIFISVMAFKSSFIANYTVPTGSMEPLILPGDKLIVDKRAYNWRIPFTDISLYENALPQRGDVIVFNYPHDTSISYIKRLIGLPGDTVMVRDGFITVNGVEYETNLASKKDWEKMALEGGIYEEINPNGRRYIVQRKPHLPTDEEKTFVVPEGHYFAMGDNRDSSADSRRWGFVPHKELTGKAKFIYFSLETFEWSEVFSGSRFPKIRTERIGTTF